MNNIIYKIVTKERKSIFAPGKYTLTFNKDSVVKSNPNTIGIFCFKNIKFINEYILDIGLEKDKFLILRVRPIGNRLKHNLRIAAPLIEENVDKYYEDLNHIPKSNNLNIGWNNIHSHLDIIPTGTVIYSEVYVID